MRREERGNNIENFNGFLTDIILKAISKRASDIHFILINKNCEIKLRINEMLEPLAQIDSEYYQKLILYIKYKSNMNLNISKSPQSSALNIFVNGSMVRVRVSFLPSDDSESIVLRINNSLYDETIENLILFKEQSGIFYDCLKQKSGLVLITGPTCSGKTTLAYSMLNSFKHRGLSVVTIEDPVEHYEKGFVQLQINENAGVTYETGVKEILRHDPDVIFIGEIRDANTAKSAIRASLTGHMVICTMHANDCLKALYRFIEFGLSILDLEQTLILVTNQRLVIYSDKKRIVFEALNLPEINSAFNYIKSGGEFNYKRISDYLNDLNEYKVIKQ